jgi:hypothetical protein
MSITSTSTSTSTTTIVQVTNIQVITPPPTDDSCEYKLSEKQEAVFNELYGTLKETAKSLFAVSSMDDAMRIGKLIGEIMKLVEKATYPGGHKIPGGEKREIALELGRCLVHDPSVIQDEGVRNGVSTAYDAIGEQLMETLLDVSRHVNVMIQEVAISCCEGVLACLKK